MTYKVAPQYFHPSTDPSYTNIDLEVIHNPALSFTAMGLFGMLSGYGEGLSLDSLVSMVGNDKTATMAGLIELIEMGYVHVV